MVGLDEAFSCDLKSLCHLAVMWLEILTWSPYLFGDDQGRDVSGSSPGRGWDC